MQNIIRDLLLAVCATAAACSIPDACRLIDSAYADCILLDGNLIVPLQVFPHDWDTIANKSGRCRHGSSFIETRYLGMNFTFGLQVCNCKHHICIMRLPKDILEPPGFSKALKREPPSDKRDHTKMTYISTDLLAFLQHRTVKVSGWRRSTGRPRVFSSYEVFTYQIHLCDP